LNADSSAESTSRRPVTRFERATFGLACTITLLPVFVALIRSASPWVPTGDDALIELQTAAVPRHLPLYGVYSRFGFHHPGPGLFILLALPYRVFGPRGLMIGATLIAGASMIGCLIVLRRRGGVALVAVGAIALAILTCTQPVALLDPWNGRIGVLPFALTLLLCWEVWCGGWKALPVLLAVGSVVVQIHLGFGVLEVWLVGSALLATARGAWLARRADESPSGPTMGVAVWSVVAVAACWVLPAIDEVHGTHNLSHLLSYMLSSSKSHTGWRVAAGVLAREMSPFGPWIGGAEPHQPITGAVTGSHVLLVVPALVMLIVALGVAGWRRARDEIGFVVIVAVTVVVGYVSIARIVGPPFDYLIRWVWVIAAALWVGCLTLLAVRTTARLAGRVTLDDRMVTAVLLTLAAVAGAFGIVATAHEALPNQTDSVAVRHLEPAVLRALRGQGDVRLIDDRYREIFPSAESGLAAELTRHGQRLSVAPSQVFEFGTAWSDAGRPIRSNLVIATNANAEHLPSPRAVRVATYDPLSPSERTLDDRLTRRAQRELQVAHATGRTPHLVSRAESAELSTLNARGELVSVFLEPAT
jgi:hypothetical protein